MEEREDPGFRCASPGLRRLRRHIGSLYVIPAQAGIQCGGSRGIGVSSQPCVPRTRETRLHAATSILDARLRGHDGDGD